MTKLRARLKILALATAVFGLLDIAYLSTYLAPAAFARGEQPAPFARTKPRTMAMTPKAPTGPVTPPMKATDPTASTQVSPPRPAPPAPPALEAIYFGFNTSTVGSRGRTFLRTVAAAMNGQPKLALAVIGHADPLGPTAYNLDLSRRRAHSVKRVLEGHGIEASRIEAKGLGAASTSTGAATTPRARAQQRRVDLRWRRHE
ncbi:MAG: OmpA family protein [Deltaproteobacteria bacterium]|nr:OmpA family protein [Deltaproteobacteria bacterium]